MTNQNAEGVAPRNGPAPQGETTGKRSEGPDWLLSNPNIDQTNITASDIVYAYAQTFDNRDPIENIALYGPSVADMEELATVVKYIYLQLSEEELAKEVNYLAELLRQACVERLLHRIDELEEVSE